MSFISNSGAVSVGSTATLILAANSERKGSLIANNGASSLFLGMTAGVTTSNGMPIASGATFNNSGQNAVWKGAIWGIVTSGTVDTRFWEWGP